jgi:hypothetical protein
MSAATHPAPSDLSKMELHELADGLLHPEPGASPNNPDMNNPRRTGAVS